MKNPQTSTFTDERGKRESERATKRRRKKKSGEQKGALAAKLSLNIISPSLMNYLFNKLLRA